MFDSANSNPRNPLGPKPNAPGPYEVTANTKAHFHHTDCSQGEVPRPILRGTMVFSDPGVSVLELDYGDRRVLKAISELRPDLDYPDQ